MVKSTRKHSTLRGPGIQARLKKQAKCILKIETDDMSISLGYFLGTFKRFLKVATCTNARRNEWTVFTINPDRITTISKLG